MSADDDMPRRSGGGFHSIASIADGMLHELECHADGSDPIHGHPGFARDVLNSGRTRLSVNVSPEPRAIREALVWAKAQEQYELGQKLCESPIEREMLAALVTGDWSFCGAEVPVIHNVRTETAFPKAAAVIVPQMPILRFRLDFAIIVPGMDGIGRMVAVECDGAAYHDRWKDEDRDAYLRRFGVQTVRVSGQHIRRNALGAANEIINGIAVWVDA